MDEEKPRSIGSIATRIVCTVIAALLILYPLSVGPAYYYIDSHYVPHTVKDYSIVNKVYAPVFWSPSRFHRSGQPWTHT